MNTTLDSFASMMTSVTAEGGNNHINIDSIITDPNQPRKTFDEDELQKLANSIEENGLLQPISVRENGEGGYIINCGERRYQAHKLLGKQTILAIVNNDFEMVGQLIENVNRSDLTLLERADFVQELLKQGFSQKDLSKQLGYDDTSWVSRHATVAKAPGFIKEAIADNKIKSLEVAQTLASKCKSASFSKATKALIDSLEAEEKITTTKLRHFLAEMKKQTEAGKEADKSEDDSSPKPNTIDYKKIISKLNNRENPSFFAINELLTSTNILELVKVIDEKERKQLLKLLENISEVGENVIINEWTENTQ